MIILGMIALSLFVHKEHLLPIHQIGLVQITIPVPLRTRMMGGRGKHMSHVCGKNGAGKLMVLIATKQRGRVLSFDHMKAIWLGLAQAV